MYRTSISSLAETSGRAEASKVAFSVSPEAAFGEGGSSKFGLVLL